MLKPGTKNYFQIPVSNSSNHDIVLNKNTIVGRAEYINSIIPLSVKFNSYKLSVSSIHTKEEDECNPIKHSSEKENQPDHQHQSTIKKEKTEAVPKATTEHQQKILASIDLARLTSKQKEMVRQVIKEEYDVFSGDDNGIEDIRSHPMKVNLKDDHPVQLNYNSASRYLYNELKMYIEVLLNKQWIVNSSSRYSSPVAAVRKKDGTMRLCCDYRKLNSKIVPNIHPLPRIQNIIDGLGGNQYFTLLDQPKASHQPHLHPNSQKLTAFITPWGFYEWLRVPFELMNFPAAFQRFMEHCLGAFRNNFAVP